MVTRREFLKTSSLFATPWILPARLFGRDGTSPSETIQVGIIGLGSRGFNLLDEFMAQADVQVRALCDVHDLHYRDRPWGTGKKYGSRAAADQVEQQTGRRPFLTADYRELCGREDLDAVVIATPDHWHAQCTLEALKEGKDVYCEKPVTHFFQEGVQVYTEVAVRDAVFQTGSQQRSDKLFQQAVNLIRNGVLGQVRTIEVGLPPGYDKPQDSTEILPVPEGLDYDMWCGPAPQLPYMRARHHRWWRGHRAYGGGVLMDWIGHHNDIAHWSIDTVGPISVEAVNWTFPETDVYNTPHQYTIACAYEGGITSTISSQHKLGTKWIGDDGWLFVTRGSIQASDPRWVKADFNPGPFRIAEPVPHVRNFLDCLRSRKPCIAPAEMAHRSITPGHLAYVSQAVGRKLHWDAASQTIVDDQAANLLLSHPKS